LNIRKLQPSERELFEMWLSRDTVHRRNEINWEQVIEPGTEAHVVSDDDGPISIVRTHNALRCAMRFNTFQPFRVAKSGEEMREWLCGMAKDNGQSEIIIRPVGKAVRFSDKLGFADSNGKFIKV
jgi:hypothetical protein